MFMVIGVRSKYGAWNLKACKFVASDIGLSIGSTCEATIHISMDTFGKGTRPQGLTPPLPPTLRQLYVKNLLHVLRIIASDGLPHCCLA